MDTQHFFPDFKPNQVLTSTQLNQLRRYLDDQTRLSRVRLTGTGIICGLYGNTQTGETIKITGGYGITTDGYIIEIPDTIFPKFRNYFDPDTVDPENNDDDPYPEYEPWRTPAKPWQQIPILELMSEAVLEDPDFVEQEDNPTQDLSAEMLDEKVLVLYLEMFNDPLKSCIVTDCNNKGENVVLTVRALLIDKTYLEEVKACGEKNELIHFPKLNAWLQTEGKKLSDLETSEELNKAYQNLALLAVDQITEKVTKAYNQYKAILNLEPQFTEMVAGLTDALNDVTGGSFNQYHFDFVRNLASAYNEFADTICPLVKTCMPEGVSPRHLMLRDFIHDEAGMGTSGKYRHHFMPSPARNVLHEDLEKAHKLFERLLHLTYNPNFGSAGSIKITPGKTPLYPLGENAIPHFYNLDAIEKWWQPYGCCELHPPLSYHKNNMAQVPNPIMPLDAQAHPLHLDPGKFNFFNIEGILGNQLGDALKKLEQFKQEFNLEFDLLGLSFDQLEEGGIYQGLEQMIETLIEIENLRQALETAILEGAEENQKLIMELLEEIAARETAVQELNATWVEQRSILSASCNISHLQADYLQLRSELICTYQNILQSLDNIPEIPPPQAGDGCVDFDELEPQTTFDGDNYPAGSEIFSESDIPVTMHEFFWTNGGTGYNWARVQPATAIFGEGNIMWTNNVNLGFDFTKLEPAPNKVTFLYKNDGGSENIQVNKGDREIVRIRNAEGEIAPGVFLEVNLISEDAGIFMAILSGPVQDLKIGGQEFSIDQVCAVAEESSIPSYPLKIVNLKRQSLERSISTLEIKRNDAKSPEDETKYSIRIERLKTEKANLENISKISGSVNMLMKDVMVNSHISGMKKYSGGDGFSRGFSPMAAGANPTQDLAYGFFLAVLDLRSRITLLLNILPKDVRGFNYLLYSNTVKEILEQIVRVRMFVNYLLDVLMAGSGTIAPFMRFLAGPLLSSITKNLARLMDFMNAYFKIRYNCFPAQLATIYFHLEHLMNLHLTHFGKFAQSHPGMEHLAGVPRGGTFILVGEKAQKNQLVRADFALNGKTGCCCEIDPEDICLPPIARIDSRLAEAEIDPQTGALLPIDINIDMAGNDLNLNNPGAAFELSLKSETSRMGASLSVVEDDNGKKLIRYFLEESHLGIDEFAYELTENTERCMLSDTGKVILMVRQKSNAPMYAGGDIAVTHQNTPVIVDVALNDVLNAQMLDSGYSLTTNATSPNGNIVEVITIENRRPALHFIPVEGFTGRDQFTYTINFANTRATGMVTVLVIPCCTGQGQGSAPATVTGTVYERTVEGLEGGLSGGTASLTQNGNTIANTVINKARYTFRNVASGTYDIQLGRWNAATGEPTHEAKTIHDVSVIENQTTTLDLVYLDEIPRGSNPKFSFPQNLVLVEPLTVNLENNAGLEKSDAKKKVLDTLTPRMAARTDVVSEIKNGGLVSDGELLEKTHELVSGKLLSESGSTMQTYKQTLTKLISHHTKSKGAEKTAYRALIDSTATSMLDEIAISDISSLSQGKQKHINDVKVLLKKAGISTNSIRKMWQSGTLKDDLKISAVTKMNKLLT